MVEWENVFVVKRAADPAAFFCIFGSLGAFPWSWNSKCFQKFRFVPNWKHSWKCLFSSSLAENMLFWTWWFSKLVETTFQELQFLELIHKSRCRFLARSNKCLSFLTLCFGRNIHQKWVFYRYNHSAFAQPKMKVHPISAKYVHGKLLNDFASERKWLW